MKAPWVVKKVLLVAALASSPLLLLSLLAGVNLFNPMVLGFQYEFEVVNKSEEAIEITPIGTIGREGIKAILPQYSSRLPAWPALRRGAFALDPGSSVKVLYDWDDINFSEILVRTSSGVHRQLVVDPNPTESQYHSPAAGRYVVASLSELPEAAQTVIDAAAVCPFDYWGWSLLFSGAVPVLLLVAWRMVRIEAQPHNAPDRQQPASPPVAGR
jgi:hypothetical protein